MKTGPAVLIFMWIFQGAVSQSARMTRTEYFERYGELAVHEMHRSGVPASITLAQGALESGDGNSTLARNANNHFGIKCHEDWNGKKTYHDDDAKNECFRKYASVEDSYKDHSDYLKSKSRYAFLFDLEATDYKGWARGLKKAGYATSPTYAESLIRIIEEFRLTAYDKMPPGGTHAKSSTKQAAGRINRAISEKNRVKYILVVEGDTYGSLTAMLGKLDWELPSYNDGTVKDSLKPGQVLYIQPKRSKAQAGMNTHTVQAGESLYDVSQLYAVKLEKLRYMNHMAPGDEPEPGTVLALRKRVKQPARPGYKEEKIAGGEEEDEIKVDLNLE
jgi:LysM repeat protein